jgi:hypothetical protein
LSVKAGDTRNYRIECGSIVQDRGVWSIGELDWMSSEREASSPLNHCDSGVRTCQLFVQMEKYSRKTIIKYRRYYCFSRLDFSLMYADQASVFSMKNSIVLSESMARNILVRTTHSNTRRPRWRNFICGYGLFSKTCPAIPISTLISWYHSMHWVHLNRTRDPSNPSGFTWSSTIILFQRTFHQSFL